MATQLKLPDGNRAKVYRQIVATLRNDPNLTRVFGGNWFVMDGQPDDAAPFAESEAPAIAVAPEMGPLSWWSPSAKVGPLYINLEVLIDGLDACDVLNLQEAIEAALESPDHATQLARERALQQLGAETGQVDFLMPPKDDGKAWEANQQHLRGRLAIDVKRTIS